MRNYLALTNKKQLLGKEMRVYLPNSAKLQNIGGFLKQLSMDDPTTFEFSMHERWTNVHPVVLSMTACAAAMVTERGGTFHGQVHQINSANYLLRMKLFDFVKVDPGFKIQEHEQSGRFIPLTQIRTAGELRAAIAELVPLLHAPAEVADPIKYVFSEMVRNVLEHSESSVGAFVSAQYYKDSEQISIGIADGGMGIFNHMKRFHEVKTPREAISLALQPGVSGTTSKPGGTEFNAGAGLFFTKSIAALSRNFFVLQSADAAFKLLRGKQKDEPQLHPDPGADHHTFLEGLPTWPGTAVGIDLSVSAGQNFADLLEQIRGAYFVHTKKKKTFRKKIRFVK